MMSANSNRSTMMENLGYRLIRYLPAGQDAPQNAVTERTSEHVF